jgi:predicted small secreted protein
MEMERNGVELEEMKQSFGPIMMSWIYTQRIFHPSSSDEIDVMRYDLPRE